VIGCVVSANPFGTPYSRAKRTCACASLSCSPPGVVGATNSLLHHHPSNPSSAANQSLSDKAEDEVVRGFDVIKVKAEVEVEVEAEAVEVVIGTVGMSSEGLDSMSVSDSLEVEEAVVAAEPAEEEVEVEEDAEFIAAEAEEAEALSLFCGCDCCDCGLELSSSNCLVCSRCAHSEGEGCTTGMVVAKSGTPGNAGRSRVTMA
jgi:hypothetical protein